MSNTTKDTIKVEMNDMLYSYNADGKIDYETYRQMYNEFMPILEKMYELGKSEAVTTAFWETEFEHNDISYRKCSNCHMSSETPSRINGEKHQFCPICGAKMVQK